MILLKPDLCRVPSNCEKYFQCGNIYYSYTGIIQGELFLELSIQVVSVSVRCLSVVHFTCMTDSEKIYMYS